MRTIITGSGCYIPATIQTNADFVSCSFYDEKGTPINRGNEEIINRFQQITGIGERKYASSDTNTSCMATDAAQQAIAEAGIDPETLDQIIVAHNFGNIRNGSLAPELVPSIAARVKNQLGIKNPSCVAYDILFGCPGWLQGLIQAHVFTMAGHAKNCLVIGAECLSRVYDPHDRDSMIYSDGAGAVVTQAEAGNADGRGIIGTKSASFASEDVSYIQMGPSYTGAPGPYLKMQGRKVYEFALKHVPDAIKACIDECGISIHDVKKIFIHQANEKMDEAIVERLFRLYGINEVPASIMPMNIGTFGNSSVATIPTLYNLVSKGTMPEHELHPNDIIVFASVGAGMNINAACYRC